MTFAPNSPQRLGMPSTTRTILFWVLMIALAAVLWKMSSKSRPPGNAASASSMSYSDFMAQVDKNNIASAKLLESPSTAEIRGQLREPPQSFRVTVPKEMIPSLTERLRKQGVPIEVSTANEAGRSNLILNVVPFIVLLAIWLSMMARGRGGSAQAPPPAQTPTNRPLG
jgi:cell division protease FtsH